MHKKHMLTIGIVIAVCLGIFLASNGGSVSLLGSIQDGLGRLEGEVEVPTGSNDIRMSVTDAINFVLSFLALLAVVVIIAAGFVMIAGLGSDASIQRARKIIVFTIIGLIVIFFASTIVAFFTKELPGTFL
jgi:hypothetical protein